MKKLFAQIVKFGIVGFISRTDRSEPCYGADLQFLF